MEVSRPGIECEPQLRKITCCGTPGILKAVHFKADELDFEDLDFHHNVLINDSESDLDYCVKVVGAAAKTLQARLEQSNK